MQHKSITSFIVIILVLFTLAVQPPEKAGAVGTVLYVVPNGLTAGACDSWAAACDLYYALSQTAGGSEVWVKQGFHRPTGTTDRTLSFVVKNGVALYGGFVGTETELSQRTLDPSTTSLSGDIGRYYAYDNSYHVLIVEATDGMTIVDGFTIRGSYADGSNTPDDRGGGIYRGSEGDLLLANMRFDHNHAASSGGALYGAASLRNVTFYLNNAAFGGGMFVPGGPAALVNVTFLDNFATDSGGGVYNASGTNLTFTNVTFYSNNAHYSFNTGQENYGGGIYNTSGSDATLTNVTFVDNRAESGGALYDVDGGSTIENSILDSAQGGEIASASGSFSVSYSGVQGGYPGIGNIDIEAAGWLYLRDNGGPVETVMLPGDFPAVDAGNDENCPAEDARGVKRPQGSHCDMGAYEVGDLKMIAMAGMGQEVDNALEPTQSIRLTPKVGEAVKIVNTNGIPLIAAERVIHMMNDVPISFTEMMGLPNSQLDNVYWLPWYDDENLWSQMRIANVSDTTATVQVSAGDFHKSFTLEPGALRADRLSPYTAPGIVNPVNDGPVKVESDQNIIVSKRAIFEVDHLSTKTTSYTEMLALPNKLLDTTYWLPWYNNLDLNTQLRIANVSGSTGTVNIYIGGAEMEGSPLTLLAGEGTLTSFAGVNDGPVKIVSDVNIVASETVAYSVNGVITSYGEMMALPNRLLDTIYWLPWYNNLDLDTQLRFGNVSNTTATVHIYIGGTEMTGSPFTLDPGASTRQSFTGINNGPVKIESDVPIIAAERVIYTIGGVRTSFSEMMGLPNSQLDTIYWFPALRNTYHYLINWGSGLQTQLRFGRP
jgi:predicted outer membrane repeat protein